MVVTAMSAVGQSFEAATVRRSVERGRSSMEGDRVVLSYTTLKNALGRAFDLQFADQIAGPAWITEDRYDINAKAAENTRREEKLAMLRNLLIERFKLTVHRETRDLAGYALVARGKLKMRIGEGDAKDSIEMKDGRREARRMSMAALAKFLSLVVQRPVIDETRLDGVYDFAFERSMEEQGPSSPAPSIFTIVEGLGLKLESRKIALEVVVVDSGNRIPIEN